MIPDIANHSPSPRHTLYLAPIRGVTDAVFRDAFNMCFPGLDGAVAPFVKTTGAMLKPQRLHDLTFVPHCTLPVVPQLLSNNAAGFINAADQLQQLGFTEINWNLGCPMPTSTKKNLGAGLLCHPDRIDAFLEKVFSKVTIDISIKTRIGLSRETEIKVLLPIFNRYPISNIIVHPRTAGQMYTGSVNLNVFEYFAAGLSAPVTYNGDITGTADFNRLSRRFPSVQQWMIGRGAIADPLLPAKIKTGWNDTVISCNQLRSFHRRLYDGYMARLCGFSHVLFRMSAIWDTLGAGLPISPGVVRKLVKSKTPEEYRLHFEHLMEELAKYHADEKSAI
jgi:tRNA-dihydrouridine synthase B